MFKRQRQSGIKKGESLVEVIMAIFIVALGSGVATSLIISAVQSNEFSRDNLIALNLAVEGVEAMRAIRDANWLKFSYDKPTCWNLFPDPTLTDCHDITKAKAIAKANYTVDLNLNSNQYGWTITPVTGSDLNLDNSGSGNDPYRLKYYDLDKTKNSDGLGGNADDNDIMGSVNAKTGGNVVAVGDSRFYRMIQVAYNNAITGCDTSLGTGCDEMDVISTVQWRAQGATHKIVLTTKLTNYQKVKVK